MRKHFGIMVVPQHLLVFVRRRGRLHHTSDAPATDNVAQVDHLYTQCIFWQNKARNTCSRPMLFRPTFVCALNIEDAMTAYKAYELLALYVSRIASVPDSCGNHPRHVVMGILRTCRVRL